jgi:uroporphyrinogen-III synthase
MVRLQRLRTICIGPVTAATAKENGFAKTIIPNSFTLDAVIDELVRLNQRDA